MFVETALEVLAKIKISRVQQPSAKLLQVILQRSWQAFWVYREFIRSGIVGDGHITGRGAKTDAGHRHRVVIEPAPRSLVQSREQSLHIFAMPGKQLRKNGPDSLPKILGRCLRGGLLLLVLTNGLEVAKANLEHGEARMTKRLHGERFFKRLSTIRQQVGDMQLPAERALVKDLDFFFKAWRPRQLGKSLFPCDPHNRVDAASVFQPPILE